MVRGNRFFESGESQLHVVSRAGHSMHLANPEELAKVIKLDALGLVRHTYQTKPQF